MKILKKTLFLLILTNPTPNQSLDLNEQINQAIQLLKNEFEEDTIFKLLAHNIGTTIFKPLINHITQQPETDHDAPIRTGFYFEKRNSFDPGDYTLVIQENHHITLGLIIGHLLDNGNLETSPQLGKAKKDDPVKKYIVLIDKKGTWREYPGIKLGKILSNARHWLINKLLMKKCKKNNSNLSIEAKILLTTHS